MPRGGSAASGHPWCCGVPNMALGLPVCLTRLGRGGTGAPRPTGPGLLCKRGSLFTPAAPLLPTSAPRQGRASPPRPPSPPPRYAPHSAPHAAALSPCHALATSHSASHASRIPQARPPSPSPGPIWGSWHLLPPRAPTSSGATCTPVRTTRAPRPGSPPIRRRCRTGFPAADTPGPGPIGLEWTARVQGTTDCQSGLGAARVGVGRAPRSRPGVAAWGCRLVPRVSPSRNPVSPCRVETPLRATSYK